jgi:hypothetical protein
MRLIAFFVCNNGFGHLHRVLSVIDRILIQKHVKILLYADIDQILALRCDGLPAFVEIVDFKYPRRNFRSRNFLCELGWEEISIESNKFLAADVVVSDGVVEILDYCNDAILMANFFWHEVLENLRSPTVDLSRIIEQQKQFIYRFDPDVICSALFATPGVRQCNRVSTYGVMDYFSDCPVPNITPKQKNILFSCGLGGEEFDDFLKTIVEGPDAWSKYEGVVFLEPDIHEKVGNLANNLSAADFSKGMYKSCKYAVVRPSFGTLNCCLSNSVFPLMFNKLGSFEMIHNSQILQKLNLGIQVESLSGAISLLLDNPPQVGGGSQFKSGLDTLQFSGVDDCSKLILNH